MQFIQAYDAIRTNYDIVNKFLTNTVCVCRCSHDLMNFSWNDTLYLSIHAHNNAHRKISNNKLHGLTGLVIVFE